MESIIRLQASYRGLFWRNDAKSTRHLNLIASLNEFDEDIVTNNIHIPALYAYTFAIAGNNIRQILMPERYEEYEVEPITVSGRMAVLATREDAPKLLIIDNTTEAEDFDGHILRLDLAGLNQVDVPLGREVKKTWVKPEETLSAPDNARDTCERNKEIWRASFKSYEGLRIPQQGALFAALAHWTVSAEAPATIVMPTGTGKTETMISLLVNRALDRIIVTVPTDNLRQQIADKFVSLGVLKHIGVIDDATPYPLVGLMEHACDNPDDMKSFLLSCNVVVATMSALALCSEDVRRTIGSTCSHLFIDEAHHSSADTWHAFRGRFHGKPILQFTATPFRNDGKHIGGKIIYAYPLRKAQEEGYFKPINFRPVFAYIEPDTAIAEAAVNQLRTDLENYDHLVMARVNSKSRAQDVVKIYEAIAPEFNPVIVYSGLGIRNNSAAIAKLRSRQSRIIVCVDMLGEGFDLPELKIAALHDIHKSLAITLQFTGRFTRVGGSHLGEATMIANRALTSRQGINSKLKELYAEDADWNKVIRDLSHEATGIQEASSAFLHSFTSLPSEIAMSNLDVKMSCVVYRTFCDDWDPTNVENLYGEGGLYTEVAINHTAKVLWYVARERSEITWAKAKDVENISYHLYVVYWSADLHLLFINSSNNDSVHEALAKSVAGDDTQLVSGPDVYKAMYGIDCLMPTNMGLIDLLSHGTRFMLLMGKDLTNSLDEVESQSKSKTNVFGYGYENGERASIGCSMKGRIWSFLATNDISRWTVWCDSVGEKLLNPSISVDSVFDGFVRPQQITARPNLVPLSIEWPLYLLTQQEDKVTIKIGDKSSLLQDATLTLLDHKATGPIDFEIAAKGISTSYRTVFGNGFTSYSPLGDQAMIVVGKREKTLTEWFKTHKPKFHFEKDTFIEQDYLLSVNRPIPAFNTDRIIGLDWTGTNIRKESQGHERDQTSVQYRVIRSLLDDDPKWDFVFDDDDSGEIADIVAIRMTPDRLVVHLYHCKYSLESYAGYRVDDFYAVCGQAQKSVRWRERSGLEQFIPHMIDREQSRLTDGQTSRIQLGDLQALNEIGARMSVLTPEFKVWIVQPGLSKSQVSNSILELLAATSLYLHGMFRLDFGVVSSS